MNLLEKIDFGNEAGDDANAEEILDFFYEQNSFRNYKDVNKKIQIYIGKKGIGKSLLIHWLELKFYEEYKDALIIKCRGADLIRNQFNLTAPLSNANDYINDWMVRISAIINRKLAQLIKLPYSGDKLDLVEAAEFSGFKSRNFFTSLLNRLKIKLDFVELEYNKTDTINEIEVLKRNAKRKIIILIDDLDATFQNTDNEKKELGTFFTACRYLSQDVKDVIFRVTLRTDVWPIIRRFDESLDKIEQYVEELKWNVIDFRALLVKRIDFQLRTNNKYYKKRPHQSDEEYFEFIINQVFVNKMPWGEIPSYTYKVIFTLSYGRPRWAIQLCKLAQAIALKTNAQKIDKRHIDTVWGEYGYKRIADLVAEHKHQCSCVDELITAFRQSERRLKRDELFRIINNNILSHLPVVIEGLTTNKPMGIAQFLYRIGFIVARAEDATGEYDHYNFSDLPDLLSNRTSSDFNVMWEIHPCYRQALDIQKINRNQRIKRGYFKDITRF